LTIVALGILIAIWGVFLGVMWVRRRAEFRSDSSIGAFQRQLSVLRRNSERIYGVAPPTENSYDDYAEPRYRPQPARFDAPRSFGQSPTSPATGLVQKDPYFRREARERRRDVMFILVSACIGTGLIAIIPAARVALFVTAALAVVLAAYVVLLVRLRAQAMERQMKLRYMPQHEAQPAYVDRRVAAR
jgi:hypothetical protein